MAKIELPPTKSSLRRLKEDLAFAYEGYDLLNQKREILAIEIIRRISKVRTLEEELAGDLEKLYTAYRAAVLDMGSETMTLKSSSEKRGYFLHVESFTFMGIKLSGFRIGRKKPRPCTNMTGTSASYDQAKKRSLKILAWITEYATLNKAIIMLSRELNKVQRRVNALEKIFIPQHEEAKKYISDRLEEMEREEVFVKKLIRQRLTEEKERP